MRISILSILFIVLISYKEGVSQDIHFSQNDVIPLYLSPANTGEGCDVRAFLNHRSQWAAVTVPYVTFSAAADKKLSGYKWLNGHDAGVGIILSNDKAGDGEFTTTRIDLLGSYKFDFQSEIIKHLSLGLSMAYSRSSINFNKLHFGSQFNGDYYDPNLPSGEHFDRNAFGFVDFSLGALSVFRIKGYRIDVGASLNHINSPKQKFYGDKDTRLYTRLNWYLKGYWNINSSNILYPFYYLYKQGRLREHNFGLLLKHSLPSMVVRNVYVGSWLRMGDAIVLKMGMDYNNFTLGFSYDINISKLKVASGGKGAIELSMVYRICPVKELPKKSLQYYCPEFL